MAKTVLAVDDSPSIRQLVRMVLAESGYGVVEARDGADALAKAQATPANLVITDLNMPCMDGLALIRELRKLPAYRGVPIILLTTESDEAKKQEGKAVGATGWMVKPFQQEQLLAVVRKVLG